MEAEHMIWMGWVMLWTLPYLVQFAGVCIGPFKHIAFWITNWRDRRAPFCRHLTGCPTCHTPS